MQRIVYENSDEGARVYRRDISSVNATARPQVKNTAEGITAADQPIRVLGLRNYVARPGRRDEFISYFETNFIDSQNALGGYISGQFRVRDADDNVFWIRGFNDKDEAEYQLKLKQMNAGPNQKLLTELREIVTTRATVILHPTKKSFLH